MPPLERARHGVRIDAGRIVLRDFAEEDRAAFVAYQTDPRYLRLYDFEPDEERPGSLFDLFLSWQEDEHRTNIQLAICEAQSDRLLGCAGLRTARPGLAVMGIELAPGEWGRYRLALDASIAIIGYGFEVLQLETIFGDTASGNKRVEKLARWFGAEIVATRPGPAWMQARGWQEVDWAITREGWQRAIHSLPSKKIIGPLPTPR